MTPFHISRAALVANGGTPSLEEKKYKALGQKQKKEYDDRNSKAVKAILKNRKQGLSSVS